MFLHNRQRRNWQYSTFVCQFICWSNCCSDHVAFHVTVTPNREICWYNHNPNPTQWDKCYDLPNIFLHNRQRRNWQYSTILFVSLFVGLIVALVTLLFMSLWYQSENYVKYNTEIPKLMFDRFAIHSNAIDGVMMGCTLSQGIDELCGGVQK